MLNIITFLISTYFSIRIIYKSLSNKDLGSFLYRKLKVTSPGRLFLLIFFILVLCNYIFKEICVAFNINLLFSFASIGASLGFLIIVLDNIGLYQMKRYKKKKGN